MDEIRIENFVLYFVFMVLLAKRKLYTHIPVSSQKSGLVIQPQIIQSFNGLIQMKRSDAIPSANNLPLLVSIRLLSLRIIIPEVI